MQRSPDSGVCCNDVQGSVDEPTSATEPVRSDLCGGGPDEQVGPAGNDLGAGLT